MCLVLLGACAQNPDSNRVTETEPPTATPSSQTRLPTADGETEPLTATPLPAEVITADTVSQIDLLQTWERDRLRVYPWNSNADPLLPSANILVTSPIGMDTSAIALWDIASGELLHELELPPEYVSSDYAVSTIAFSADEQRFAAAFRDERTGEGVVGVWEVTSGQFLYAVETDVAVFSVAFSPDGTLLATNEVEGVHLRNASNGDLLAELPVEDPAEQNVLVHMTFSPDGDFLVASPARGTSGSIWNTLYVWRVVDGELVQSLEIAPSGSTTDVAFSPDGTVLAVNGGYIFEDKLQTLKLWSVPDWELLQEIDYAGKGGSMRFSPDGQRIAVAALGTEDRHKIEEYSVSSGNLLHAYGAEPRASSRDLLGYTPDGSVLITDNRLSDTLEFWDTSSGEAVYSEVFDREIYGGCIPNNSFWFSPDGAFLLGKASTEEVTYLLFWGLPDTVAADPENDTGTGPAQGDTDSVGSSDSEVDEEATDFNVDPNLTLVKTIDTGRQRSSRIPDWVNANGTLFFTFAEFQGGCDTSQARDAVAASPRSDDPSVNQFELTVTVEDELWTSDGTEEGTVRVKDLGTHGTYRIDDLTNVNGTLFFVAEDATHGAELWMSDGTADGTMLVKDINPGSESSEPSHLTNVNDVLFFIAEDGTHGAELWKSDGTADGTVLVKDIQSVYNHNPPFGLTNVDGTLFFAADDDTHGRELWKSDGTEAGTTLVKDIFPGDEEFSSDPSGMMYVNGTLFFTAFTWPDGRGLWRSDGTAEGTTLVTNILSEDIGISPLSGLVDVDGTIFFATDIDQHNNTWSLWKSDGTTEGTVIVTDMLPARNYYQPQNFTNVDGTLFFTADDGTHGIELWKSNGTAEGTTLVKDINPGAGHSVPQRPLPFIDVVVPQR